MPAGSGPLDGTADDPDVSDSFSNTKCDTFVRDTRPRKKARYSNTDRTRKRGIEANSRKKEKTAYHRLLEEVQQLTEEEQALVWSKVDADYRPKCELDREKMKEMTREAKAKYEFPRANLMAFAAALLS